MTACLLRSFALTRSSKQMRAQERTDEIELRLRSGTEKARPHETVHHAARFAEGDVGASERQLCGKSTPIVANGIDLRGMHQRGRQTRYIRGSDGPGIRVVVIGVVGKERL